MDPSTSIASLRNARYAVRRAAGVCLRCATLEAERVPVERKSAVSRRRYARRRDHASYYTSAVPIMAGRGYRLPPREPLPRLFRGRRVGDFEQAVAGVAIDVTAQDPGLAPFVDGASGHSKLPGDLVAAQKSAIAQPLIAGLQGITLSHHADQLRGEGEAVTASVSALVEDFGDLAIGVVVQQPVDLGDDFLAGLVHLAPERVRRPGELSGRAAAQPHPQAPC